MREILSDFAMHWTPPMNILAVTCMRNEGPYCLEWIAHHRAAGITDFLIYSHDCEDGTDLILDLLPDVTHVSFVPTKGKSVQWRAMQLADRHPQMQAADWVMFFDCDEFLCLKQPLSSLPDLIASVPKGTDAIALPWRLFGSSNHQDLEPGLTLERFTKAAPEPFFLPAGHFFKTLFRPEKFQKLGVHRPKNKGVAQPNWSLGGNAPANPAFATDDKRINLFGLQDGPPRARLNHYSTRSVTEFMIKSTRGLPNRRTKKIDLSYWAERNFNTVSDHAIGHMLPATRTSINAMMALHGIQHLIDASIQTHHAKFADLMQHREAVMMYLHLSLLAGSEPPNKDQVRAHLSRLEKVKNSEVN
jgi:hypothetical protein